ncbi:hypothetical protein Golob_021449 [Gossypium lobatum]|uniref:RNase H type-1 domain-containing protein n=1 Tax=Gossypium lobatum TaxID=34289 RepID=A0A7J8LDJ1_9ROSI|nr:hypothetical protein [Gossypium lobatum]
MRRGSRSNFVDRVLRDQNGNWILGYNHYLGKCTVFEVELWGILDGILILLSKSFNKVTIQIDNLEVVRALQGSVMVEDNLVADCLAKLSLGWKIALQIYDDAPNEVLEVLQQDKGSDVFEQFNLMLHQKKQFKFK